MGSALNAFPSQALSFKWLKKTSHSVRKLLPRLGRLRRVANYFEGNEIWNFFPNGFGQKYIC